MEITIGQIENKIYNIRGLQVMLDSDLAEIYQIETKVLNQAVKRNLDRFPNEFRFQLNNYETTNLWSHFATTSYTHNGGSVLPYVFTDQGVSMLSAVLRSDIAVKVSIQIIQVFVAMRKTLGQSLQPPYLLYNAHLSACGADII